MPAGTRREALAGVALLTRSRPAAVACQWLLYLAVAAAGPRAVPGPRALWEPPGGAAEWRELAARVGPFDALAVYERPQRSRQGLAAVLLNGGRPRGFLKVRDDPAELDREERAMAAFPDGRAPAFRVPRVLDRGETAGRHWMLLEAMPPRPARPARHTCVTRVAAQVQDRLAAVLPRPAGIPGHWRPMHGDLTMWNLRRCGAGLPWLIDWEDAAWAPPEADPVYYAATRATVLDRPPARGGPAETVDFWLRRVAARSAGDDASFNRRLAGALRAMR
ncbi:phosphotransferase [Actinomadura hibisca]|uniref:phosphotransferase n=1 Tax=Actinomadura hibisca TaxID=68565 RepID=UPI000AC5AC48|nr:phosphotransferase [Actinomadura hibisca]